jgi:hypothetical protein
LYAIGRIGLSPSNSSRLARDGAAVRLLVVVGHCGSFSALGELTPFPIGRGATLESHRAERRHRGTRSSFSFHHRFRAAALFCSSVPASSGVRLQQNEQAGRNHRNCTFVTLTGGET